MGLIKVIIIFFIGWAIYGLYRRWQSQLPKKTSTTDEKIDTMVKCENCGVHLPKQNAIEKNGQYYCCEEHADG